MEPVRGSRPDSSVTSTPHTQRCTGREDHPAATDVVHSAHAEMYRSCGATRGRLSGPFRTRGDAPQCVTTAYLWYKSSPHARRCTVDVRTDRVEHGVQSVRAEKCRCTALRVHRPHQTLQADEPRSNLLRDSHQNVLGFFMTCHAHLSRNVTPRNQQTSSTELSDRHSHERDLEHFSVRQQPVRGARYEQTGAGTP
jgi:hypothetical protein